jgi:hypothetical protein
LYVTWDDNSTGNYEIYFAKSTDGGNSFGKIVNISKNLGVSGRSSISTYSNNVYVVWNDNSTGNYEIYFAKSTDVGNNFSDPINLSKNIDKESFRPYITASANNIYVVWTAASDRNHAIFFTKSTDHGNTFSDPINLSKNTE